MRGKSALLLSLLIISPALSGCFSETEEIEGLKSTDVIITPQTLIGAIFQEVEFTATRDLSIHIPYFIIDDSGLVSNSTTLNLKAKDSQVIDMLAPTNMEHAYFLIGEYGERNWESRASNQSWEESFNTSSQLFAAHHVSRPPESGISTEEGANHSTGLVNGLAVLEWMEMYTDANSGYNERWGPFIPFDPVYERALGFLSGEFSSMGMDAQIHRYPFSSTPAAVNICGYKTGSTHPDEWLVLGAHLDIAEIGSGPGGGTHIGAHDNTAGVAMVLEAARGLSQFEMRRTLAVCFWSNEENGYFGVDRWIDDIPEGVSVTNYLNIDSAGVNYPGDYTLVMDVIPDTDDQLGEQWEMIHLAEWLGSNNNDIAEVLRNGRQLYHEEGYDAMKDHDHTHPNTISVHESQRGRSDYIRFAYRLDVVSMDFGAITGGYDCYHAPCDTLETMIEWMATENRTGQQNLVESFDLITWWFVNLAFHLDETPIHNE
ncbi:MAG: M28 family peptidase [Candidatus Poseidoniaceae archaeon]|nr:M28 family peptidase [Candidatus Poseidoniaceae archaeon]